MEGPNSKTFFHHGGYEDLKVSDKMTAGTLNHNNGGVGNCNVDMKDVDHINEAADLYGWFSWRPRFLQWLNNPKGYLFFLCVYLFGQGMTVNGLIYVVITTLERRFNLPSVQSAFISSTYDFFFMFFVVFVTYFGERAHKPKLLGIGAIVFSCGSIVFTLPHFLTGPYNSEAAEFDTCDYNRTELDLCAADDEEEDLSKYYPVFIIAQGLHALGASAIYTLGITYIDENSSPGPAAVHTAIFTAMSTLGPAVGFLLGSSFLDIYTDFNSIDSNDVIITPESPLWVGAWWLGFIITACICILVALPLLGFNKRLPSYESAQKLRAHETRLGAEFNSKTTSSGVNKISDFPKAVWTLLKNPTYLFIDLAVVCEGFLISFVSVFGPKIIESLFNLSSGDAALYAGAGIILIPAGIIGALTGGFIVKRYDLKVTQILKFCIAVMSISGVCLFGFLLACPNVPFAGVTVQYENTTQDHVGETNLTAECNINCNCEGLYDPVCGSNGVMYYSSCHAGCTTELDTNTSDKKYTNCSCILGSEDWPEVFGTAVAGKCGQKCSYVVPWLLFLFGTLLFTFMVPVPYITATIRCVDYSQRSFALGLQTLLNKALGFVPGPIAFGALVDKSCLLWEYECSGSQNCWIYDNWQISIYTLLMAIGFRCGTLIFYSFALISYKPSLGNIEEIEIETSSTSVNYVKKDEQIQVFDKNIQTEQSE